MLGLTGQGLSLRSAEIQPYLYMALSHIIRVDSEQSWELDPALV